MGYGEYGGGGSVNWKVHQGGSHNAQLEPGGNPKKAGGNDDGPGPNDTFTVYVNGVILAVADIATSRISVVWEGGPQPGNPARNVAMPNDPDVGHGPRGGGGSTTV